MDGVLGGLPVTQHDHGKPDQADSMNLILPADRRVRVAGTQDGPAGGALLV